MFLFTEVTCCERESIPSYSESENSYKSVASSASVYIHNIQEKGTQQKSIVELSP